MNDEARFCQKCGHHPVRLSPTLVNRLPMIAFGILLLAGIGIWLLAHFANTPPADVRPTAEEQAKPIEVQDPLKPLRQAYVEQTRNNLHDEDIDASVSDSNGTLTIIADLFRQKSTRDTFASKLFDKSTRSNLCAIGFKSFELKNGYVLYESSLYSLDCPETADERKARIQAGFAKRQAYVQSLQRDIASASSENGDTLSLSQSKRELIVVSVVAEEGFNVRKFKGMVADSRARAQLCEAGFTGVRLKNNLQSKGVRIPIQCH
jgi:hypothetical protein